MTSQEFLQKAERIAKETAEAFKNRKNIDPDIPNTFIMSYEEFDKKYGANLHLENAGFDVLVFDGDLDLNNDVNSEWLKGQFEHLGNTNDRRAMFVRGNLTIDGDILDNDEDNYLFLQVAGDVYCHYVYSENGNIVIRGNLTALLGTTGEYNDGMLSVYGTTTAPYIVSNDHSMSDKSQIDYIFINNGRIGETYHGGLEGWNYFEDSQFMMKDDILEDEYQVDLAVFFDYIKRGENPFVSVEDYEAQKNEREEEYTEEKDQQEIISQNWEKYHNSTVVKRLYIYDYFVGSDDELFEYIVGEYEFILQITDENERYRFKMDSRVGIFYTIVEHMVDEWEVVTTGYSNDKVDTLRQIVIKAYTDMANYILKVGDMSGIEYLYNILNDEMLNIEKDEPYFYVALVKLGLRLEKYEEIYSLLLKFDSKSEILSDYVAVLREFIDDDGYQNWKNVNLPKLVPSISRDILS